MKVVSAIRKQAVFRRAAEWAVFLLLGACFLETWFVEGFFVPYRVAGGSMAERLPGEHFPVVCADCGHTFLCGIAPHAFPARVVCPNCGYAGNKVDAAKTIPGRRLFIDRTAYTFRRPRRWEIVVLRNPRQADAIAVKRVVGLPGETVKIAGGEVFINGRIARKNIDEQRSMAVLVYDATHPSHTTGSRWFSESNLRRWRFEAGRFVHLPNASDKPVDWLIYHHYTGGPANHSLSPITDLIGYNQSFPRREEEVHVVVDLLLSFRLTYKSGTGTLYIRAGEEDKVFVALLELPERTCKLQCGDERITTVLLSEAALPAEQVLVELSLIDRQYILALNGKSIFSLPWATSEAIVKPSTTPFAIGAQGIEAAIEELKVFRDVYYHDRVPTPTCNMGNSVQLGPEEYFLLGDNSPISEDSRHWPHQGAVSSRLLLGKPLNPRKR